MDKDNKTSEPARMGGTASVIVAGIFVICMVFFTGKVVFASNADTAPAGLDTATINTNVTEPQPEETTTTVTAPPVNIMIEDSSAESSETESSQPDESLGTKYITEYAYLHTQPSNDAENIICMTPGIGVEVLNYEDNGYVKVTFNYIDGPMTGYIYRDYLSDYQTVVPYWEQ